MLIYNSMTRPNYCLLLLLAMFVTASLDAHSGGPKPSHTGGFSEKTCTKCHVGNELNSGRTMGGVFYLEGVPKSFEPGKKYPLKIIIGHPNQSRWGFQLSSRFAHSGTQAGRLLSLDESTQVKEAIGIQYLEHTEEGTREMNPDGPIEFELEWIAPASSHDPILFNAAGNAADDSGDPEGDFIYTAGGFSRAQPGLQSAQGLPMESRQPQLERVTTAPIFYHIGAPADLKRGQMEFQIQHRFLGPLNGDSLGDLLGVDRGANINLGLSYAITNRLSTGVARARFNKIVTLNGTWEINTERESLWNMSLSGGVEGQDNFQRHYSPYLQLATTFDYGRFRFLVDPTLVLNSRNDEEVEFKPNPVNPDDNHTFSLGLGVDAMISRNLSAFGELVPRVVGFGGFGERNTALSGGIKIRTWGHVFTVGVSNSQTFTPARYAVNAGNDFSLGFNIYRRIR
jgi:hypothetical protein